MDKERGVFIAQRILYGLILNRYSTNGISMAVLNITVTIKYILGQVITFCVPGAATLK